MTPDAIRKVIKAFALIAFAVGGVGCVLCVPFALGTRFADLLLAGIYFVAGGIMIIGGLGIYAFLIKDET